MNVLEKQWKRIGVFPDNAECIIVIVKPQIQSFSSNDITWRLSCNQNFQKGMAWDNRGVRPQMALKAHQPVCLAAPTKPSSFLSLPIASPPQWSSTVRLLWTDLGFSISWMTWGNFRGEPQKTSLHIPMVPRGTVQALSYPHEREKTEW